jgi:hypothetical protein
MHSITPNKREWMLICIDFVKCIYMSKIIKFHIVKILGELIP